jgi:hypothetical protein
MFEYHQILIQSGFTSKQSKASLYILLDINYHCFTQDELDFLEIQDTEIKRTAFQK